MEIHYNNPELKIGKILFDYIDYFILILFKNTNKGYIDYLKVRYFMTTSLQKNELGALTLGADMSPFSIALPPNAPNMRINTICPKECLSNVFITLNYINHFM